MPGLPLNLAEDEGAALAEVLAAAGDERLVGVEGKLARLLRPRPPEPIPGQTTIYDQLKDAA